MTEAASFTVNEIIRMCIVVCPLVFLAGFIDSIAGGGGLISTPAYMFTGIPMHYVLGTNKAMSSLGTTISTARYLKSGKINKTVAIVSAIGSFIGAAMGSQIALRIDSDILKKIFVFIIPFIAIFVVAKRKSSSDGQKLFGSKMYIACVAIGIVIGIYDGVIGPGTGTFLIFGFNTIIGLDYITSSGSAKVVNLASNLAALTSFLLAGKILWPLAIPAACFNMLGCYVGSEYAIKNGDKVIKKVLILVLIGIFIKLIIDVL